MAGVLVNKSSRQAAGAAVEELNALATTHRFGSERASPDDHRVLADFVNRSDHVQDGHRSVVRRVGLGPDRHDRHRRHAYCSPSAASVLHLAPDSLHRTSLLELIHPGDRPDLQRSLDTLRSRRDDGLRRQARVVGPSGETAWCEFTVSNQLGNPAIASLVPNAGDVSAHRALREQLTHDADRRRLHDALESSLRGDSAAVLFLDLDGFKAGDELLRQVDGRLSHCARDGDVVARIGGDESVMLLPGTAHRADAVAMSAEVRNAIGQPFRASAGRF